MEIGERWGYREPPHTPGKPLAPVDILQFGPPKSKKVRIRRVDGEFEGLTEWVAIPRLQVLWDKAEDFLDDEVRFDAVVQESRHAVNSLEHRAAMIVAFADSPFNRIRIGTPGPAPCVVIIDDLERTCRDLGIAQEDLFADPVAYIDYFGGYVGPWSMTLMLAKRLTATFPDLVLDHMATKERELREKAEHGEHVQHGRQKEFFTPPEFWVSRLREEEPVFALVREWCGAEPSARFDEVEALRADVKRLRSLVLKAARELDMYGHPIIANRLRRDVGARTP